MGDDGIVPLFNLVVGFFESGSKQMISQESDRIDEEGDEMNGCNHMHRLQR